MFWLYTFGYYVLFKTSFSSFSVTVWLCLQRNIILSFLSCFFRYPQSIPQHIIFVGKILVISNFLQEHISVSRLIHRISSLGNSFDTYKGDGQREVIIVLHSPMSFPIENEDYLVKYKFTTIDLLKTHLLIMNFSSLPFLHVWYHYSGHPRRVITTRVCNSGYF